MVNYGLFPVTVTRRGWEGFTSAQRNTRFSSTYKLLNIVHPPAIWNRIRDFQKVTEGHSDLLQSCYQTMYFLWWSRCLSQCVVVIRAEHKSNSRHWKLVNSFFYLTKNGVILRVISSCERGKPVEEHLTKLGSFNFNERYFENWWHWGQVSTLKAFGKHSIGQISNTIFDRPNTGLLESPSIKVFIN